MLETCSCHVFMETWRFLQYLKKLLHLCATLLFPQSKITVLADLLHSWKSSGVHVAYYDIISLLNSQVTMAVTLVPDIGFVSHVRPSMRFDLTFRERLTKLARRLYFDFYCFDGDTVLWLARVPHCKKVAQEEGGGRRRTGWSICGEFTCSPCVCVDFVQVLWFPLPLKNNDMGLQIYLRYYLPNGTVHCPQ